MNITQKEEKFWDRLAGRFDRNPESINSAAADKAKPWLRPGDQVLDFGCATGTVSCAVAPSVGKVLGIDISSKMIEFAREKAERFQIENVDFQKSSLFDQRLEHGTFDLVLAFNVLHLIPDTRAILRRTHALLKPGGLFISLTTCMGNRTLTNTLLYLAFQPLIKFGAMPFLHFFKREALEEAVIKEGFQMVEQEAWPGKASCFLVSRKLGS
ncbi:class I SAM-dependent methyltransferase [Flavilitoribacter nigricans]|uniref:Methyltransferase domain-containing protein n=1 Tax=Flavilitoribacter nigricans (strain ATCC 23147 / DSM 23189 / NBRC 102662 / NCIMB 1420 / SS-2) TaxID=1122177 RepID=A0A2D0NDR0_FLAN2|nr:class I SAM-dependent methyltransferase [Flavilitoribacter nigricans]PHN05903.1 hypothetical protein CRP01_13050 [Flavilitoribacter nigricans DSM 23189 = NBRC 102662]